MSKTTKKYRLLAAALAITISTGFSSYGACQPATAAAEPPSFELSGPLPSPPPAMPGAPNSPGMQEVDASELTACEIADDETRTCDGLTLNAQNSNESAFLVRKGGSVTLTNSALSKTGDSSSADASNFSGQNAVFLASNSTAVLKNITLRSDADGANAIFATGQNATIKAEHIVIHTKNNSSRGLDATYDGTIEANDVDITTEGAHCGALATDRGEGSVIVTGAKLTTSGEGSPCIYSTGNIQLTDGRGEATGSEIAVVEGKNSITLNNSGLTGHVKHGVMLYQSFSGDAGIGEATFTAKDSTLNNLSAGPMFYITNTTAVANLENTQLCQAGDVLVNATSDRWGSEDKNGGIFTLNACNQQLNGKILANNLSQVTLNLGNGANWTGSFNEDYQADKAVLQLSKAASWNVTADSYLTVISDDDSAFANINSNGHKVYYDKSSNPALGGKTYDLPGGGKLLAK
ncbi:hypothetical protein SAMN02910356_02408 [Selenomonas sp. GACV-9]|uniref:hypothetical protein n=1 Tax=Selenomonas sp. GACV-9 TaxID=3158782 RepID=UPI0008F37775|nr:hypothetical protein SAMN02910356_02408 [Selenomonas ruminantium]